jgi:hypothetical protein
MSRFDAVLCASIFFSISPATLCQENDPQTIDYLRDRGPGIPTSQFGTYIEAGQWILYPFVEYEKNTDEEYSPIELRFPRPGFVGEEEFLGESTQTEAVFFVGYGLNEKIAIEFEAELYASAELVKSPLDTSPVPPRLSESGFAGAEAQIRWMMREETRERPAMYSFAEVEFPFQDKKVLIGAQDFEAAVGIGFIRAYSWGTLNYRASIGFDGAENKLELGEYAIEYLKRVNDRWRFVATVEGEDDEVSLIGEAQLTLAPRMILKLNSGFGLTEKAADIAPEIGVLFTF